MTRTWRWGTLRGKGSGRSSGAPAPPPSYVPGVRERPQLLLHFTGLLSFDVRVTESERETMRTGVAGGPRTVRPRGPDSGSN